MMEAWEVEERCQARNLKWEERGALPRADPCFNQNAWQWLEKRREEKERETSKARAEAEAKEWARRRDEAWKAEHEKWKRLLQGFER